eukprot:GHVS01054775.1.p1 GENE.GHVS01054775.1~~GHVS01054775.1.p1  ORF type:complete len:144 (+),score=21.42 GHVS01054775.1:103-534(+)
MGLPNPPVCSPEGSPPDPAFTPSTEAAGLSLSEAYKRLSSNCAIKGGLGLLVVGVPVLVAFRGRSIRLLSAGLGAGIGFGWSLKEADIYLKNPAEEKCPGSASLEHALASIRSATYDKASPVFKLLPEKWRSKTSSDDQQKGK